MYKTQVKPTYAKITRSLAENVPLDTGFTLIKGNLFIFARR